MDDHLAEGYPEMGWFDNITENDQAKYPELEISPRDRLWYHVVLLFAD